jgi:hypothetical protein
MADVQVLLSRLQGVRKTRSHAWVARCPAHADNTPSLSISDAGDGLMHCFAGCEVQAVLDAVDLTFDDLFPDRAIFNGGKIHKPFLPTEVFEIARREVAVVAIISAELHKKRSVSDADYERVFTAVDRLNAIASAAYGR